ncbi:MAG: NfeD family protein [Alphaproteobacteria bacterium]
MTAMYGWLAIGVLFMALEALGLPGAGFLFVGLGALLTGILISLGFVADADTLMQFVAFFLLTGVWAAVLWKPLQRFKLHHQEKKFNNIVGDKAKVGKKGLGPDGGEVVWSGTIMTAKLAGDTAALELRPGANVTIVDVEGTTLIVRAN